MVLAFESDSEIVFFGNACSVCVCVCECDIGCGRSTNEEVSALFPLTVKTVASGTESPYWP